MAGQSSKDRSPSALQYDRHRSIVMRSQLRRCGHLTRMPDHRIPKIVFYSELQQGSRLRGRPNKCYKDNLKDNLFPFQPTAHATVLRLPVVCRLSVAVVCNVMYCGYKRCVLEQKLLLLAYTKSHMRNRLVPKWYLCLCLEVVLRSCQPLRRIRH